MGGPHRDSWFRLMLRRFESWPDVLEYVRSGGAIYYVPNDTLGPCRTIVRIRPREDGQPSLWVRPPEYVVGTFESVVADETYLDKLYRWEARKAEPRSYPSATTQAKRTPNHRDER